MPSSGGCRHFLVGIGGSATNDGGIGMLQALGFGMLDKEGKQVPLAPRGLRYWNGLRMERLCRNLGNVRSALPAM